MMYISILNFGLKHIACRLTRTYGESERERQRERERERERARETDIYI